jgi:hypothetical protein
MDERVTFTPGGPKAPEQVHVIVPAADQAAPPGGPRHRSHVRRIESGERVRLWNTQNLVTRYGENTLVAANSTTAGEVVISF